MQKVGSSSPFPSYQHSASPRYHPHSQREDHGDVEYEPDPNEEQQTHRMMMPILVKRPNDQGEDITRRQEDFDRSEQTVTGTYDNLGQDREGIFEHDRNLSQKDFKNDSITDIDRFQDNQREDTDERSDNQGSRGDNDNRDTSNEDRTFDRDDDKNFERGDDQREDRDDLNNNDDNLDLGKKQDSQFRDSGHDDQDRGQHEEHREESDWNDEQEESTSKDSKLDKGQQDQGKTQDWQGSEMQRSKQDRKTQQNDDNDTDLKRGNKDWKQDKSSSQRGTQDDDKQDTDNDNLFDQDSELTSSGGQGKSQRQDDQNEDVDKDNDRDNDKDNDKDWTRVDKEDISQDTSGGKSDKKRGDDKSRGDDRSRGDVDEEDQSNDQQGKDIDLHRLHKGDKHLPQERKGDKKKDMDDEDEKVFPMLQEQQDTKSVEPDRISKQTENVLQTDKGSTGKQKAIPVHIQTQENKGHSSQLKDLHDKQHIEDIDQLHSKPMTDRDARDHRREGDEMKHQREKEKGKEGEQHSFVSHARTRFEERDEKRHGDMWNKPTPRSEHPDKHHHEHQNIQLQPTAIKTVDHRHEGGGSTGSFNTEQRGRMHQHGEHHHQKDTHHSNWDKEQQQDHLLQQRFLQQQHQPHLQEQHDQRANVTFEGVAVVTVPNTEPIKDEHVDMDLERERLARLQSETARMHGGIVPKDSDVSFAQSEIDRKERERLEALRLRQQREPEQVVIPMVIETNTGVVLEVGEDPNTQKEESKRLHHIHDDIMQEIKSGPHLDSFNK